MTAEPAASLGVFSPSEAAFEGFRVIRRHWRVVAGWAAFNIIALIAMVVVTVVVSLGVVAGAGGGGAIQLTGAFGAVMAFFGTFGAEIVLAAGLLRLMLRPDEPGFLHLRIGPDELRLGLVWFVMLIGAVVLLGAGVVVAAVAGRISPILSVLVWFLMAVASIWLGMRFVLAPAASFEERRLAFGLSWRLTRGRVWPLLGMSALVLCLIAFVVFSVWLALFLSLALGAGFGAVVEAMNDPNAISSQPELYVVLVAVELVLSPFMGVLGTAPVIAAYRGLIRR